MNAHFRSLSADSRDGDTFGCIFRLRCTQANQWRQSNGKPENLIATKFSKNMCENKINFCEFFFTACRGKFYTGPSISYITNHLSKQRSFSMRSSCLSVAIFDVFWIVLVDFNLLIVHRNVMCRWSRCRCNCRYANLSCATAWIGLWWWHRCNRCERRCGNCGGTLMTWWCSTISIMLRSLCCWSGHFISISRCLNENKTRCSNRRCWIRLRSSFLRVK